MFFSVWSVAAFTTTHLSSTGIKASFKSEYTAPVSTKNSTSFSSSPCFTFITSGSTGERFTSFLQSSFTCATITPFFPWFPFPWHLHSGHWFFQWPHFLQVAHWSLSSGGNPCLHVPCWPLPFSSFTAATSFLTPCLYPSSQLLKTLYTSSKRASKFLPSGPQSFWSLCLMSPVDCPKNKFTSCSIPTSDPGSSHVWRCITSLKQSRNLDGDSEGPCLIAYKADQFIVLGIALSIPHTIYSW